eukprot:1086525-Pelagomonas_calceolata.AAC.2
MSFDIQARTMVCCAQKVETRSQARFAGATRSRAHYPCALRNRVSVVHGLVWFKPRRMGGKWQLAWLASTSCDECM